MVARLELTGQRFGRWLVRSFSHLRGGFSYWQCVCDCGATRAVMGSAMKSGQSRSCGCLGRERVVEPRQGGNSERVSWQMVCHQMLGEGFGYYGDLGVHVEPRWRESFDDFIADMGAASSPSATLTRIDQARGYEPGNCRWEVRYAKAQPKKDQALCRS